MTDRRWHPDLPDDYRDPAVLAFVATMLAWKEGDAEPVMPAGVTKDSLPELIAQMQDPKVRRAVVTELSVLIPHSNRRLRRRGKGHGKGHGKT